MRRTLAGGFLSLFAAMALAGSAFAAAPVMPDGFKANDKLHKKMTDAEAKAEKACDLGTFVGHRGVLIGETGKAIGNLAKALQDYEKQNPGAERNRLNGNPDFFQQSLIDQINIHVRYLGQLTSWQFQPPPACPPGTRTALATPSGLTPADEKRICGALAGVDMACPIRSRGGSAWFESAALAGFGTGGAAPAQSNDNFWDTALRYAGEFSGFRLAVGPRVGVGETKVTTSNLFDRKFAADASSTFEQNRSFTQFGVDVRLNYGFTPQFAVFGGGGLSFTDNGGFESVLVREYAPGDTVRTRVSVNPNFATVHGGATVTVFQGPAGAVRVSGFGGLSFHELSVSQGGDAGAPYSGLVQTTRSTPFFGVEGELAILLKSLFPAVPNDCILSFVFGYRSIGGTTLSVSSETPFATITTTTRVDDTDFFYGAIRTTFTF